MLIGILQCGHPPENVQDNHGNFDAMFSTLLKGNGFSYEAWDVVDGNFPSSPNDAEGWLVTGSKHGAYENHSFINPLTSLIKDIYASMRPMVGVCFGHQIIAQSLGGKVEKFDGGWAIGRQNYIFGSHGEVSLNAWHQDQVVKLPDDAEVIASNDFCKNAALVYGTRAYTIQPHPELSNAIISDYIIARRGNTAYPPQLIDHADKLTNLPTHDNIIANDIAAFFKGDFKPEAIT